MLDANGWAVNGRVKVNMPLGMVLTDRAVLPAGASRSLQDPYVDAAEQRRRTLTWVALIAIAAALALAHHFGKWPFAPR